MMSGRTENSTLRGGHRRTDGLSPGAGSRTAATLRAQPLNAGISSLQRAFWLLLPCQSLLRLTPLLPVSSARRSLALMKINGPLVRARSKTARLTQINAVVARVGEYLAHETRTQRAGCAASSAARAVSHLERCYGGAGMGSGRQCAARTGHCA